MARWRLTAPHYLNVEGTEWQYSEIDRQTGRPKTLKFAVPKHLDPGVEADWNVLHRDNNGRVFAGDIVICRPGQGQNGDYEYKDGLTPDMFPLDDEAKAESAAIGGNWKRPVEGLANEPFAQSVLAHLESKTVDPQAGMNEMQRAIAMLAQQMSILTAAVTGKLADDLTNPTSARKADNEAAAERAASVQAARALERAAGIPSEARRV